MLDEIQTHIKGKGPMKKLALFLSLLTSTLVFAGTELETTSFTDIEKKTNELIKKHGAKNVLVVLDIDNTILTMPQELGSDQWYTWQYEDCIKKQIKEKYCITNNMGELLSHMGKIFALSKMIPTEKQTPKVVKRLQEKGVKLFLLTSRGPDYRNATERELKRNGYNIQTSAIGPKGGFPGTFIPYTLENLSAVGLTKADAETAKLRKARKISYMNGVMMTAGLNKGIMLKTMLAKTKSNFKAIVFADDHIKHTKRMQAIMGNIKDVELVTFRYGAIDPQVKAFKAGNKKSVINAFNQLNTTTQSIFK